MISMTDAAISLESLCDVIEVTDDITPALINLFEEKKLSLTESVDRRIRFMEYLKSQINHSNEMARMWDHRKGKLEKTLEKIKEMTLAQVKGSTVPMIGNLGKLKAVKNSVPTLIIDETDTDLVLFYTKEKVVKSLDRAAIKEDLLKGINVKSARLEFGEHLRY